MRQRWCSVGRNPGQYSSGPLASIARGKLTRRPSGSEGRRALPVMLDRWVHKATRVLPALKVQSGPSVRRGTRAPLVRRGSRGQQVLKGFRGQQVRKVSKAILVRKLRRATKATQGRRVRLARREPMVLIAGT